MSSGVLHEQTLLPPEERTELREAARAFRLSGPGSQPHLVGPDGSTIDLPDDVYQVLRSVVEALSEGMAITVAPHNTMLTTQEAADLLGISRPTLVRLLDEQEIPHSRHGRHRRIRLNDVVTYQQHARQQRRALLDEMTTEAEDTGMYDVATS